jgi:hypothetical protein
VRRRPGRSRGDGGEGPGASPPVPAAGEEAPAPPIEPEPDEPGAAPPAPAFPVYAIGDLVRSTPPTNLRLAINPNPGTFCLTRPSPAPSRLPRLPGLPNILYGRRVLDLATGAPGSQTLDRPTVRITWPVEKVGVWTGPEAPVEVEPPQGPLTPAEVTSLHQAVEQLTGKPIVIRPLVPPETPWSTLQVGDYAETAPKPGIRRGPKPKQPRPERPETLGPVGADGKRPDLYIITRLGGPTMYGRVLYGRRVLRATREPIGDEVQIAWPIRKAEEP